MSVGPIGGTYYFDLGWGRVWYSGQIPNQGDDRSTFFSWFEIGLKFSVLFSAVTLFKYSKYSFFLVLILAYTDHPRRMESKVPLPSSTSKAKKAVSQLHSFIARPASWVNLVKARQRQHARTLLTGAKWPIFPHKHSLKLVLLGG